MKYENIIIPKENIAKTEEVRELETQENPHFNKFFKSVLPTVYCMPDGKNVISGPSLNNGVEVKAGVNSTGAIVKTGVDLVNVKAGALETRVGVNFDTGASVGTDDVEVKMGGFGVSIGKKAGVSTPFGKVAVNADDCIIQ